MKTKVNFLEQICLMEGIQKPNYVMYTDYGQKASQARLSSEWGGSNEFSSSELSLPSLKDYGFERLRIYDFPESGGQLHIHSSKDGNIVTEGSIKSYSGEKKVLNGYEASLAEFQATLAGFKPKDEE